MKRSKILSSKTSNTVFIGSPGPLSLSVLKGLLSANIVVSRILCAGIAPARPVEGSLPVSSPDQDASIESLASDHQIPLDYLSQPSDLETADLGHPDPPDYILVACFPFRVPEAIIHLPRIGCLNIHPSLLPRYRGPDPIFWQLKNGETPTGVSLHLVTADFDNGPVVGQKQVPYREGAYKKEIEIMLGAAGAELFSTLVAENAPLSTIARQQDESISSYYPNPTNSDYQLSPGWSARQAFNFIRGTWPPPDQYRINIDGTTWIISQALGYTDDGELSQPVKTNQQELYIQFSPGILRAHAHIA